MKKKSFIQHVSLCLIFVSLLFLTGCLERKEEIIVSESGDISFSYEIDGDAEVFDKSMSYPTDKLWDIREEKRYTDKEGNSKIKLKASLTVKSGKPLPKSFSPSLEDDSPLLFPTQLKIWTEGSKTFYRFERTYQARMFMRFNIPEDVNGDTDVDERVLNEGIFNVSEADRNQYIENLSTSMMYHTYATYLEAIGDMVIRDKFPLSKKAETELLISEYIEEAFSDSVMLHILSLDETSMDSAYDNLLLRIDSELTDIISEMSDRDQSRKNSPLNLSLKKIRNMYDVTEALSSDKFSVSIFLPGDIISTNGFTGPEEKGIVYWEFSGKDLHDAHIPIFALSVVEK